MNVPEFLPQIQDDRYRPKNINDRKEYERNRKNFLKIEFHDLFFLKLNIIP
jgi:hypothetical protein